MGVQVNLATKDGKGAALPFSKRQFISFSYGGKNIEDFDLIAVFSSDRLDKDIYAPFNDITSTNDTVAGQMFWASIFQSERLTFTLATDGMTSENYELFKQWFKPNLIKKLKLSEFSNRYAFARVASAPHISLLPFEDKRKITIADEKYEFSTSLYKGEISLEFILDKPGWFAEESYLSAPLDKDKVKIIYEDKVPTLSMFPREDNSFFIIGDNQVIKNMETVKSYNLTSNDKIYLYNCGSNLSDTKLSFDLKPLFEDELHATFSINNEEKFPSLLVGSKKFSFTTPNILTSYNQAVDMILEINSGDAIINFREKVRDELHNYYARAWLMSAVNAILTLRANGAFEEGDKTILLKHMVKFLQADNLINFSTFSFSFDSEFGIALVNTTCRIAISQATFDGTQIEVESNFISIEENAGDMLKSEYLKLEGGCYFNPETGMLDSGARYFELVSNFEYSNLSIDFKYTYL